MFSQVTLEAPHPLEIPKPTPTSITPPAFDFRVKKLGAVIILTLGASLAAAAVVTATLATLGIMPLVAALEIASACTAVACIALWRKYTYKLPEPLKKISQFIQALADDILARLTLFLLFPLNLERFDPKEKRPTKEGEIPILFIHGFFGRSNNWVYHRRRLQEKGYRNLFTINLGDPRQSIGDYAKQVNKKILSIQKLTRSKDIILVAHSMGGLVAKEYLYHHKSKNVTVRKIITIGTPLGGAKLARLGTWFSKCAAQMVPHSQLIQRLTQAQIKDKKTEYLHIGSAADFTVSRASATAMPRPPRKNTQIEDLEATGHVGELFSDTVGDYLVQAVEETNLSHKS